MVRGNGNGKRPAKTGPKPVIFDRLNELESITRLFGANNKKIAEYFNVSVQTVDYWVRQYPEVRAARDRGWAEADARVVDSLYRRALGYSYTETEYKVVLTEDGEEVKVPIKETTKHLAADIKACMFILSNRHRDEWLTRMNVHHSGDVTHRHLNVEDLPVDHLEKEEQEALFKVMQKQLTDGNRDN